MPAWRVDRPFDYLVPRDLAAVVSSGWLVRVPFGGRRVRGVVVDVALRTPERDLEAVVASVLPVAPAPPPMPDLIEWVAARYCCPRGVAYARVVPPRVRVKVSLPAAPARGGEPPSFGRILSYLGGGRLLDDIRGGGAGAWCLQTVPGEERGALISELVAAALEGPAGAALVAVPEVRYGSAVVDALAQRWPSLARTDSAAGDSARSRAWLELASGARVGAGGRSVVLAPAPGLRVLVIDEEQHLSFKEDRWPRYHARRVALERCRLQEAVCVLMSSTPSVETGHAARNGRLSLAVPPGPASRAARPIVEVAAKPADRTLSRALHRRITEALRRGARVALLVAARGFARAVWCARCRRSLRCPVCESGVGYEHVPVSGSPGVRCPRCGWTDTPPAMCPSCGGSRWRLLGAGSERVADQAARAWPRASVAAVDPDTPGAAGSGSPDIYVTTWIGTKAVLRPPVSLVGVLDADALLRRPDFRSSEAGYHALAEMSEWAGPAAQGGRLVIQCSEPSHHAVQAVVRANYGYFLERELAQRAELRYPPFTELVRIEASGASRDELAAAAAEVCARLGAAVLGPISVTSLGRTDGRGGTQLLAKCEDAGAVAAGLRGILAGVPRGSSLRVDVDPR